MPRPSEIAADARALYGPVAARPAAADMGDGALWIDPGAGHALYQVQSGNWVRIGTGTAAPAAPAGVPVLYGPYVVDYTDIPHDGDKKTLWTPQVGDVLLRLFVDIHTLTQFDHGILYVGQNPDVSGQPSLVQAIHGGITQTPGQSLDLMDAIGSDSSYVDSTGAGAYISAYVFATTDPLVIVHRAVGLDSADMSHGHVEIYALTCRPVSP